MAAPGFGFSVGDFISGIQLLGQIIGALRNYSQACTEYESTVAELELIRDLLTRVQAVQSGCSNFETLSKLRICAEGCNDRIARFAAKLQRYENALAVETPGGKPLRIWLRRAPRKIRWALVVQDDLEELRATVTAQLHAIGLHLQLDILDSVLRLQTSHVEVADTVRQCVRVQEIGQEPPSRPGASTQPDCEVRTRSLLLNTKDVESSQFLVAEALDHGFLMLICFLHLMKHMVRALTTLPKAPSWLLDTNIILTDALGRRLSLPYEHFNDWSMIAARLKVAFKGCAGEGILQREAFVLSPVRYGSRGFLSGFDWSLRVRPGCQLVMALAIQAQGASRTCCPRCGFDAGVSGSWFVTCPMCSLQHYLDFDGGKALIDQADYLDEVYAEKGLDELLRPDDEGLKRMITAEDKEQWAMEEAEDLGSIKLA